MIPVISGTVAGQSVSEGSTINPFANTSVSDGNPFVHDTLTITLLDSNGNATDANGSLQLAGGASNVSFSETSPGVYVLVDQTTPSENTVLAGINSALPRLTFIPSGAATTTFSLFDLSVDAVNNTHDITDNTTTVTAGGASRAPANIVPTVTTVAESQPADPTPPVDPSPPAVTSEPEVAPTLPAAPIEPTVVTATTIPATNPPTIDETGVVPPGQAVDLSQGDGHLVIDHVRQFHGKVHLVSGNIDLKGLSRADSFSFQNDMLSIFGAGRMLGRLNITGGSNFSVEKTAIGISIYTAGDTLHPSGALLPLHV